MMPRASERGVQAEIGGERFNLSGVPVADGEDFLKRDNIRLQFLEHIPDPLYRCTAVPTTPLVDVVCDDPHREILPRPGRSLLANLSPTC